MYHVCLLFHNCFIKAGIMFREYPKDKAESEPLEKIKLKHLIIPFFILGVGCFVSLVVFLLEMFCGGKGHQPKKTISGAIPNM